MQLVSNRYAHLKLYQILLRVAFTMTVVCLCVFVWCTWVYCSSTHTTTVAALTDLTSSYEYYDMNRGFAGIRTVGLTAKATACALGSTEEKLYRWPGSVAGYSNGGKYYTGVSSLTTDPVLTAHAAFYSNYWKGAHFCLTRQAATTMVRRASTATACAAANQVACTTCDCYQNPTAWTPAQIAAPATQQALCPVSNMNYGTAAPTGYATCGGTAISWTGAGLTAANNLAYCTWGSSLATQTTYLVDLWVEMGAAAFPCIDMYAHPAPVSVVTANSLYSLLAQDHAGCGTLGNDNALSSLADTESMADFQLDNSLTFTALALGATFDTWYTTNKQTMNLYSRKRIQLACTPACAKYETFNFKASATALVTTVTTLWGTLKTLVYTSGVLAFICLIKVLWAVHKGQSRCTQRDYLMIYVFCLACTFIMMVFCWYICYATSNDFNTSRNDYNALAGCIQDKAWAAVATGLYTDTSLNWFHNWMIWWVVASTLLFVFGVVVLLWVMSSLGKLETRQTHIVSSPVRHSHVVYHPSHL